MTISSVAIIPARYGSKRLPLKNFRTFKGKPIINYTVEAALGSKVFDQIVISSDHPDLERICCYDNVALHRRAPEIASDTSRVVDVVKHILDSSEIYRHVKTICVLYPTAPLRTSQHIIEMVEKFESLGTKSLHAVTTFDLPVHQAIFRQGEVFKKAFPKIFNKRSDEVPNFFVDNGSTYLVRKSEFDLTGELVSDDFSVYKMRKEHSVDLDTEADWELLEFFARREQS